MTQEDKELLLKDLCARLPYGVKFGIGLAELGKYDLVEINTKKGKVLFGRGLYTDLENCRPFLRPMETMTKEERLEFSKLLDVRYCVEDWKGHHSTSYCIEIYNGYTDDDAGRLKYPSTFSMDAIDWLNSHHFDYRGLIEKGLALEAPEGMYNIPFHGKNR